MKPVRVQVPSFQHVHLLFCPSCSGRIRAGGEYGIELSETLAIELSDLLGPERVGLVRV